jgi:hypothetical protein
MLSEQPPQATLLSSRIIIGCTKRYRYLESLNAELPHISASAHIQPDGDGDCNSGERRSNRSRSDVWESYA